MRGLLRENLIGLSLLIISFLAIELVLRGLNYPDWWRGSSRNFGENWIIKDQILGWMNAPGSWTLLNTQDGRTFRNTFLADGSRASGESNQKEFTKAFFGDSYVEGYGLADDETFVSLLQREFQNAQFKNFGVPGYGTYQSYLLMKRVLSESRPDIYYLLNSFHEQRNVADRLYLRRLRSTLGLPSVPFVTIDQEGKLVFSSSSGRPFWRLSQYSAAVAVVDEIYSQWTSSQSSSLNRSLTQRLIVEMAVMAKANHVNFKVILFDVSKKFSDEYSIFFKANHIDFTDCSKVSELGREFHLTDGHPNQKMNIEMAKCIAASFRE